MARTLAALISAVTIALAGTAFADTLRGTGEDDRLDGTERADVIRGRGGDDVLRGHGGRDLLVGGPGDDRCLTDDRDRPPSGCEDVVGPAGPLLVTGTTGTDGCLVLRRAEMCYFVVEGHGADAGSGSVTGEGGVRPTGSVSARRGHWSATGTFACEGDGAIAVAIAGETARAPVDCPPI